VRFSFLYSIRASIMSSVIPKQKPIFVKVNSLKPESNGHNLIVKVVNTVVVVEKTRGDNSKIRIAECLIGDETGCIILTARNEQIDRIQPGMTIIIRNAKVDMFKGFMRLGVDRWGKIESTMDSGIQVNTENNLSTIEYELVTQTDE